MVFSNSIYTNFLSFCHLSVHCQDSHPKMILIRSINETIWYKSFNVMFGAHMHMLRTDKQSPSSARYPAFCFVMCGLARRPNYLQSLKQNRSLSSWNQMLFEKCGLPCAWLFRYDFSCEFLLGIGVMRVFGCWCWSRTRQKTFRLDSQFYWTLIIEVTAKKSENLLFQDFLICGASLMWRVLEDALITRSLNQFHISAWNDLTFDFAKSWAES